jgi:hypothetical protein
LIDQRHPAPLPACATGRDASRFSGGMRRWNLLCCALAMCAVLSGCRHKPVRAALPIGVLTPVDLETPPATESAPEIASIPLPEPEPLPSVQPPSPPRRRPPPGPKESEQPTQVASNDVSAELAIGALSAGGDGTTHTALQAQDVINAVLKRVAALSSQIASARKQEVRQVRNFIDQAEKALKSGDAEGAHTLATKAGLLMDDVEKK